MRLLSIDPSIVNCGVAIIEGGEYKSSYTFRPDVQKTVEERLIELSRHFTRVASEGMFDCAIIEIPSAFIREGDYGLTNVRPVQLLHLSIGAIIGGLSFYPLKVELVRVQDWKGNAPKEQTQAYARGLTGKELNTHEADACMMAINWLSRERFRRATKEAVLKQNPKPKNRKLRNFLKP